MRAWLLGTLLVLLPATVAAERLVVAGGALTEILFELGAGDSVVAVDSTSGWPPAARELPRIGYVRDLPVEGVLAQEPDRVIVDAAAGPTRNLKRIARVVPVERIDTGGGPGALPERVRRVAALVDREAAGERLAGRLAQELAAIRARVPIADPPATLVILAADHAELMIAGRNTQAQALLDVLGLDNVAADIDSYKPMNREAVLELAPEMLVVADTRPGQFDLAEHPALAATPAARQGRVLVRDSMFLLGAGPRQPAALRDVLMTAIDAEPAAAWIPE